MKASIYENKKMVNRSPVGSPFFFVSALWCAVNIPCPGPYIWSIVAKTKKKIRVKYTPIATSDHELFRAWNMSYLSQKHKLTLFSHHLKLHWKSYSPGVCTSGISTRYHFFQVRNCPNRGAEKSEKCCLTGFYDEVLTHLLPTTLSHESRGWFWDLCLLHANTWRNRDALAGIWKGASKPEWSWEISTHQNYVRREKGKSRNCSIAALESGRSIPMTKPNNALFASFLFSSARDEGRGPRKAPY